MDFPALDLIRAWLQHTTFCMRAPRMPRDVQSALRIQTSLVTFHLSLVAQFSQRSILLGGPTSPLSTRTDFRSRLDRGVTIVARATCIRRVATPSLGGLLIRGGHILFLLLMVISRSYYLSLADIVSSGYFIPFFTCDLLYSFLYL